MNQCGLFNGKIHYEFYSKEGVRDLVVFVHPLGMNRDVWQKSVDALEDQYAVLVIDLPGHGKSSTVNNNETWSISSLAQMIQELIVTLGYDKMHYVGTSIGGAIGQELLLSSPALLQSAMVTNTSHQIGTVASWAARAQNVRQQGLESMAAGIVPRWFGSHYLSENMADVAQWQQNLEKTDDEGYAVLCEALGDWSATDRLSGRNMSIPALAVAGSEDPAMPLENMQQLASLMQVPLEVLPIGHVPSVEDPEGFNQLLLQWLGDNQ